MIANFAILLRMTTRGEILRQVMSETGTTQTALSRISGTHQPSISQFLSGKVDLSDEHLDGLLSCMGYRLEVVRRPVRPRLTRSELRSWMLHRQLSGHLTSQTLTTWLPSLNRNLVREGESVRGSVHLRNVDRWRDLIERRDVLGLHRVMTGLDRSSIEMREVSPMGGILSEDERRQIMADLRKNNVAPRPA